MTSAPSVNTGLPGYSHYTLGCPFIYLRIFAIWLVLSLFKSPLLPIVLKIYSWRQRLFTKTWRFARITSKSLIRHLKLLNEQVFIPYLFLPLRAASSLFKMMLFICLDVKHVRTSPSHPSWTTVFLVNITLDHKVYKDYVCMPCSIVSSSVSFCYSTTIFSW